jgi:cobalt-zinc-cadmium resistance protein CzcA
VQFSIQGRDLARAVGDAQEAVRRSVQMPQGYRLDWGGEYSEYVAARQQIEIVGPLAILLIFVLLFALYGNLKFPATVLLGVIMTEPVGALLALKLTHTTFSVSSALGLLVLLGVSAETGIINVSYINKLRLEGQGIRVWDCCPRRSRRGLDRIRRSPSPSSSWPGSCRASFSDAS